MGSSNAATPPAAAPQTAAPVGNSGASVDWNSSASAEEVFEVTRNLAEGERRTQGFSVTGAPIDVELIFAAQYRTNLYVMPESEAANFLAGRAYQYFPSLSFRSGTFGYLPLSQLPVGNYVVAIENTNSGTNSIRLELQRQPVVEGFRFAQARFDTVTQTIGVGNRFVQYVTLGDTYRTIIDGANTGGTIYVLEGNQAQNFLNGAGFQYITNHPCGSGQSAPGFCELKFRSGVYAIAYVNDTSAPQSIVMYGRDYVPR